MRAFIFVMVEMNEYSINWTLSFDTANVISPGLDQVFSSYPCRCWKYDLSLENNIFDISNFPFLFSEVVQNAEHAYYNDTMQVNLLI